MPSAAAEEVRRPQYNEFTFRRREEEEEKPPRMPDTFGYTPTVECASRVHCPSVGVVPIGAAGRPTDALGRLRFIVCV